MRGRGTPPLGLALVVAGSALGLWSAAAMSTKGGGTPLPSAMPNSLVVAGPYRFVRNPMAVAGIVQAAAVGLLLSSWLVIVYAIGRALVWNYAVRPLEEADLEARFGDDFRRYRSELRCWWPRLIPLPARARVRLTAASARLDGRSPPGALNEGSHVNHVARNIGASAGPSPFPTRNGPGVGAPRCSWPLP